jgi:hypothetical protein
MSFVVGCDVSTKAVDLVRIDETTQACAWNRIELRGTTALERLRDLPHRMPKPASGWWDDCYLAAFEAPMGRGQAGTIAKLSRVLGAVIAHIPTRIELWEVTPQDWRRALELPGNAPKDVCAARCVQLGAYAEWEQQDAYDAYAVAFFARQVNQRGIEAA